MVSSVSSNTYQQRGQCRSSNAAHARASLIVIKCVLALGIMIILNSQVASSTDISRSTKVETNPIRQISILGERNSGTRWTFE